MQRLAILKVLVGVLFQHNLLQPTFQMVLVQPDSSWRYIICQITILFKKYTLSKLTILPFILEARWETMTGLIGKQLLNKRWELTHLLLCCQCNSEPTPPCSTALNPNKHPVIRSIESRRYP